MIYLVGGPVRVGKSTLAKMVLHRNHVSSISTDALTTSIGRNLPETRLAGGNIPQQEWEENAYPFIRRFLKNTQYDYPDFLLEGAVISPKIANRLSQKLTIKAIFIGNTQINLDDLLTHMGHNLWLRNASPAELDRIPQGIIDRSYFLQTEAAKYNYPFIDLAGDFNHHIEQVYQRLFH
jgi:hypothetical protein